jgi:multidrug efflux pump subunit AcrB
MRFSHFFIDRPIFAGVISVFITLVGIFAYPFLPLAQYPDIAPPSIVVMAPYPGASAETLAETVATPIEQEINGVQDMLYLTSSSSMGRPLSGNRNIQAGHRPRCGAGAGAEPRSAG